ncbi:MAG TPA: ELWxxDGT repeat protein, partial [Thermoanaerobaculia bacterium]|nr:ELWxxDGT repeat protein [Thermoanaerobaculia bacterium]
MRNLLWLSLFLSISVSAQTPYLVKDINTTNANLNAGLKSSSPAEFAALGDKIFFVATTDAAGTELWSTDGTSGGTKLVADIVAGSGSSSPSLLRAVNGVLLFNARDVNHGIELWTSDGTAAGTHLLSDISPGPTSSQPGARIVYKNKMLFSADDGTNGRELWVSDGTAAGTKMLADLNPGSASSFPAYFVQFGGSVYFCATGGLWKTDGTAAGTVNVSSTPGRFLTVAGSRLFFEGFTPETGWELWTSDGTSAGTHMVTEIDPGTKGAFDSGYEVLGLTAAGDRVFFLANDGVHGREMWVSDGTAAGTSMVRDFLPGAKGMWDTSNAFLTAFNGRAYFVATDADHGSELWVTDGTDAGTHVFVDLAPGPASSYPFNLTAVDGKLMFTAVIDSLSNQLIWISDGTPEGTRRLDAADALGSNYGNTILSPAFWPIGGKVYFGG